jgi:(S)-mandelate dehydrogenase
MPVMENLLGLTAEATNTGAIASSVGRNYDPSFDWDALRAIRDSWPKKLIIKGVVRPDDAERAVALGADAVVVSNHGGRQLDGGIATLDALPAVAQAVGNRVDVLMDGGVRRGTDVVKAVALGARAILIGRATLYGAIVAGEAGATRALDILQDEVVRAMQLAGVPSLSDVNAALLAGGQGDHQPEAS